MIKKFFVTALFILFFANSLQASYCVPSFEEKIVRVGISNSNFQQYYYKTISVSATDKFKVKDKNTNSFIHEFEANEVVNVEISDNLFKLFSDNKEIASNLTGPIEISSEYGFVTVPNLKRAGKPAYYRGTFEITKAPKKDNQFNLINILGLQAYLRGVVPNEMPVRFGHEALKAQAVLARNYAIKPRETNYHNYDVCDSVACQVYYGANTEKPESDRAINETKNIVAMHDGELILALYSSTAGGYTESYENAFSTDFGGGHRLFPGTSIPYLKGVPDFADTPVLDNEENFKNFYLSTPETFDNASPYFRWTKEWTEDELLEVLKKTLKSQSATGFVKPKFENPEMLGNIKEIKVQKRGVSGKAMSVDIVTDKGTFNIQKELVIRRVFQKNNVGLPSANVIFEISEEKAPVTGNSTNNSEKTASAASTSSATSTTKSTQTTQTMTKTEKTVKKITARGGGFGHGVGMSQFGAGEMAKRGFSFSDIIQHYYKNSAITTYPIELSSKTGQDTAVQTFYTTNQNASLVVENKFHFTKFTVVINAQELLIEAAPVFFKPDKVDLTPYLVKGENKITYILPYSESYKKPIRLFVELKPSRNE